MHFSNSAQQITNRRLPPAADTFHSAEERKNRCGAGAAAVGNYEKTRIHSGYATLSHGQRRGNA